MNIHFCCKNFSSLTNIELYHILQLRYEVFVVEQNCAYQDLDNKDFASHHLMMWENELPIAYARIIPKNISYEEISIGRVASIAAYRNKGIGKMLMNKAIEECYNIFGKQKIMISAQVYAVGFYEKFGFEKIGTEYLEDNIPHIKMILK